jgi:hypothetical protein
VSFWVCFRLAWVLCQNPDIQSKGKGCSIISLFLQNKNERTKKWCTGHFRAPKSGAPVISARRQVVHRSFPLTKKWCTGHFRSPKSGAPVISAHQKVVHRFLRRKQAHQKVVHRSFPLTKKWCTGHFRSPKSGAPVISAHQQVVHRSFPAHQKVVHRSVSAGLCVPICIMPFLHTSLSHASVASNLSAAQRLTPHTPHTPQSFSHLASDPGFPLGIADNGGVHQKMLQSLSATRSMLPGEGPYEFLNSD